jgi:LmbE family N-acetylglucosaminyl deacetylase
VFQKIRISILLLVALVLNASAQQQNAPNSAAIVHSLQKLKTIGRVLYIAAHPDDENTRLLSFLANERKYETVYLSLTRGDGGQNLIGKEQGAALGLIRTQELLAARRTDGAKQLFTRANDFGYSKTPEETFQIWNHDSVLSDVVLAIRKFKPDVIIARFPTNGDGGHGHHTASAILAEEAFAAAADVSKFPMQVKQYGAWQVKRLFWNAWAPEGKDTIPTHYLKVDVGVFNPQLGMSYGEIAAESRSNHKSQGFGSARIRGERIEYLEQLKGDTARNDFFNAIGNQWQRFGKQGAFVDGKINECIKQFVYQAPYKSVNALVQLYKIIEATNAPQQEFVFYKTQKLKDLEEIILACSGIWLEALADNYSTVAGGELNINAQALTRYNFPVSIEKISFANQWDTAGSIVLGPNKIFSVKHKMKIPKDITNTNPYWLQEPPVNGLFQVNNSELIGTPENEMPLQINYQVKIANHIFSIQKPLTYKYTDPVRGEVYHNVEVLPLATINLQDKAYLFSNGERKQVISTIKSNADNLSVTLSFTKVEGLNQIDGDTTFTMAKKGSVVNISRSFEASELTDEGSLAAQLKINNTNYNKAIQRIEYDHIPYQFILSNAQAKVVPIDLKMNKKRIAYIPGAGDDVAAYLSQVGYQVTVLTDEMIAKENLNDYDAIIAGVRLYNTNDNILAIHNKLMQYVQQGGNYIVQYNTNSRAGPLQEIVWPYKFTISRDRVTNEKAAITFLNPNHAVLNAPNKITQSDFENWIQERCIYAVTDAASQYQKIFSMSDANDKAVDGSLIIAPYGKGNFVYTGIVFFREIPAGIPGAYRLMANLIDLPKN